MISKIYYFYSKIKITYRKVVIIMYCANLIYIDEGGFFEIEFFKSEDPVDSVEHDVVADFVIVADNKVHLLQKVLEKIKENEEMYASSVVFDAQISEIRLKLCIAAKEYIKIS